MSVQYSQSFVDRACESKDIFTLYSIVHSLGQERILPEPLKVFVRLWDWCCMTRSGIWQYYEGISSDYVEETAAMLERHHLGEIASRYRAGLSNWEEPHYCGDLDDWIEENWDVIEEAALNLVKSNRESLYPDQS